MKTKSTLLAFLAAAVLLGCKKDQEASHMSYGMRTVNPSAITARTAGTLMWNSGTARATEIKFEAENQSSEVEYKSMAVQQVDLFSSVATIGNIQIPAGTYKEVEFKIAMEPSGTTPALVLQGTYNGTPILFQVNTALEIESEKENITIADGSGYKAITTIDLSTLTRGITDAALANATRDSNGQLVISASSNANLYSIMLSNLKEIGEAEVD